MKTIFRVAIVLAALALIASTFAFAEAPADYKAKCAMCHGANGNGNPGMKTIGFETADVQKMSDAELTDVITKGKGKMPSYEGKLSKEQIDGIVKWIRTLKK